MEAGMILAQRKARLENSMATSTSIWTNLEARKGRGGRSGLGLAG
jgi:hypothetical protein